MKERIKEAYDGFVLDEATRAAALEKILQEEEAPVIRSRKAPRRFRWPAVAAACAAFVLAFGGVAYAAGWFGLGDVTTGQKTEEWEVTAEVWPTDENGSEDEFAQPEEKTFTVSETTEMIALAGPAGSPEYEAQKEWNEFETAYSREHMDEFDCVPVFDKDYYSLYSCYNQTMADKLDEICEKYGLKPHQTIAYFDKIDGLYEGTGFGSILPEDFEGLAKGYYYDDGSFHLEFLITLSDGREALCSLSRDAAGTFNEPMMNVGDSATFEERQETTADGVPVVISERTDDGTNPTATLVFASRPESFVVLNVQDAWEEPTQTAFSEKELTELLTKVRLSELP